MPELDESEVVKLAQAGDTAAFEQLLSFYEKQVFSYIFRFVTHKENAEDLVQETFIKIYRSLKTFDPEYKFKTWLFTVATNTVYDWLRKAKKSKEIFIIDDPDTEFETIDKKSSYKDIEDRDLVSKLIDNLKPAYKSVLLLFYQEQLSYEEIADVMRIPINTVKTYLHRAKKEAQKYLKD